MPSQTGNGTVGQEVTHSSDDFLPDCVIYEIDLTRIVRPRTILM